MPGTSFFHQARNNAASNQRLYDVCQKLTSDELTMRRTAFSSTILEILNHILTVDWYYFDAMVCGGQKAGASRSERADKQGAKGSLGTVEIDFGSFCKVNIYYAKSYRMSKILSSK